jgi:predicted O-methyltransferase YrrM
MPQNDDLLKAMLEKAGVSSRVDIVVGDANDYQTGEMFDLAFIDGDHSYNGAAKDHNKWGEKVRVGGYIVHHDMSVSRPLCTSRHALEDLHDDILRVQRNDLELVREAGSMTIFRRTAPSWTPLPLREEGKKHDALEKATKIATTKGIVKGAKTNSGLIVAAVVAVGAALFLRRKRD